MKTALALGTFDGIHIAHRFVLEIPCGYKKIAVTFAKPPKMVIYNNYELLMSFEDKINSLKNMGFDEILALDFEKVKDMPPLEFLDFLYKTYRPKMISCGFNYRFGKNGEGNTQLLQEFCNKKGICLKICEAVKQDEIMVSSTAIRNMLKLGELDKANALMQSPFSFSGEVIKGDKRGRKMGFPTINQKYPSDLVKLKFGVYKTKICVDSEIYEGITNIGMRPTFKTDYVISETFIKDFSEDLYGKTVRVIPIEFIRPEKKFSSLEDLTEQIKEDLNYIK